LDKILDVLGDFGWTKIDTLDSMFVRSLITCEENVNIILRKKFKQQLKCYNECHQSSAEY